MTARVCNPCSTLSVVVCLVLACIEGVLSASIGSSAANAKDYSNLPPTCSSQIYCQGDLLDAVQRGKVFPSDSKTFVDRKLKYSESEVLAKYQTLLKNSPNPDNATLTNFVNENFEDGDELEVWSPPDFSTSPSIQNKVVDPKYKQWTLSLNQIWKELGRKVKEDVKTNPGLYSLIYTPNGFFIPGGRFRELYYWDTYWIVQGILLCDMKQSAKGVVENIISLVDQFGFMPNGARVYYLERSQPPLLIPMAANYMAFTGDYGFLKTHIKTFTNEFEYWTNKHMVTVEKNGKYYKLARYYAPSRGPRPESYREDFEEAEHLQTEEEKNELWIELKSGAETGWDFSSRWFIAKDGSNKGNLHDIKTTQIVPVDLNAMLQKNAVYLSEWHLKLGNKDLSIKYKNIAREFNEAIQEVLWNDKVGAWLDYDTGNKQHRNFFYLSNLTPLWTNSYTMHKHYVAEKVLQYLRDNHVITEDNQVKFYGTPSSMLNSSQQWDYPNAWAPLQAFIIQGLDYTQDKTAQLVAYRLADNWIRTNYYGYEKHQAMFEKYDSELIGETGNGGEYAAQTGFGWTNGFVFELLNKYGKILNYKTDDAETVGQGFKVQDEEVSQDELLSETGQELPSFSHPSPEYASDVGCTDILIQGSNEILVCGDASLAS
uniref:Trehalase n=1 Tax=Cacopsylla melanoneura TaxID=428564 RepID=A0A8D8Y4L3_9HEMI